MVPKHSFITDHAAPSNPKTLQSFYARCVDTRPLRNSATLNQTPIYNKLTISHPAGQVRNSENQLHFIRAQLILYAGYLEAFGRHRGKPLAPLHADALKIFKFKTHVQPTKNGYPKEHPFLISYPEKFS